MVADPTSNQNVFIFMEFRKIDETPPFGGSGILDPSLLFQDVTIALAVFGVHRPNAEQLELDHPICLYLLMWSPLKSYVIVLHYY